MGQAGADMILRMQTLECGEKEVEKKGWGGGRESAMGGNRQERVCEDKA